jgi:hypothetical protein
LINRSPAADGFFTRAHTETQTPTHTHAHHMDTHAGKPLTTKYSEQSIYVRLKSPNSTPPRHRPHLTSNPPSSEVPPSLPRRSYHKTYASLQRLTDIQNEHSNKQTTSHPRRAFNTRTLHVDTRQPPLSNLNHSPTRLVVTHKKEAMVLRTYVPLRLRESQVCSASPVLCRFARTARV